ncbi:MAG: hypothetical protein PHU14_07215 [Methylovulum sp.]|nr:hypothetical protein [Methylovulum sp.]
MSRHHQGVRMQCYYKLNCGRHIHLEVLFQYYTYRGLIEGTPNKGMNRRLVNEAQEQAKDKLWLRNETPFLIQPLESPISLPKGYRYRLREDGENEPAKIPSIVCLATFQSQQPAKNPENHCSSLSIVWFQNEFALPIDPTIEETIRGIDWNALANDWDY